MQSAVQIMRGAMSVSLKYPETAYFFAQSKAITMSTHL